MKKRFVLSFGIVFAVMALAGCKEPEEDSPVTAATSLKSAAINIATIEGLTIPATGETPVMDITETEQYSGTVTWNGNPSVFAAVTVYTATITLKAKET